jgi:hypothetical protein
MQEEAGVYGMHKEGLLQLVLVWFAKILQQLIVKPMAILDALREAIARGWTNIVFESDSKILKNIK